MNLEIRTLAEGDKITENGFYNIPLSVHHNQPCDGFSVTSGVLRAMELDSPAEVWAFHKCNPNGRVKPTTPAMYMGAAMAALISGGMDELRKQFLVLKKDVPRRPTEAQRLAYDEKRDCSAATLKSCRFWDKVAADGRPPLTYDERQELLEMSKVLAQDPAAQVAMEGLPEITMAVFDEESRLWLLSRPDTVSPENGVMSDYKRMAAGHSRFNGHLVDRRIEAEGYGMQMAFGCDVYHRLTGNLTFDQWIVAQSVVYPYHVIPRGLDEAVIRQDVFRVRKQIKRVRECLDTGIWPGPGHEIGYFRRSDRFQEIIEDEMQREGFVL